MIPFERLKTLGRRFSELRKSPTIATWIAFALKALSFVALYPFVLRAYTPSEIGFWLATGLTASLVALIDVGLTPTFVRLLSYALAGRTEHQEGGAEDASRSADSELGGVIGTLRYLYRLMTIIAFLGAATIAVWIAVGQEASGSMWIGWGAATVGATAGFWGLQYQAWLQARQRISEMRMREVCVYGGALAISMMLAITHQPILTIVFVNATAASVLNVMNWRAIRTERYGPLWQTSPVYHTNVGRSAIAASWRSGVGVLTSYGLQQGVMAWYAAAAAPKAAASFLLTMRLLQALSQIAQAPFYTKLPQMAVLYAKRDTEALAAVARRGAQGSSFALAVAGLVIVLGAPAFLTWSHSNSQLMSIGWLTLAFAGLGVERAGAMLLQVFTTSNVVHWHWINGLTAVAALTIGCLAWSHIKDFAIPLAWLLAVSLVYAPLGFWLCKGAVGVRTTLSLLTSSLTPLLLSILVIAGTYFALPR